MTETRCRCESGEHPNDTCSNTAGSRRADMLGPVCDTCADTHLADYILADIFWFDMSSEEQVAQGADLNGMLAVVSQSEDYGDWWWAVNPTSRRSEWPECDSTGNEPSREAAVAAAEKALRKADASYPFIQYY
jgi:hypothetical protein